MHLRGRTNAGTAPVIRWIASASYGAWKWVRIEKQYEWYARSVRENSLFTVNNETDQTKINTWNISLTLISVQGGKVFMGPSVRSDLVPTIIGILHRRSSVVGVDASPWILKPIRSVDPKKNDKKSHNYCHLKRVSETFQIEVNGFTHWQRT